MLKILSINETHAHYSFDGRDLKVRLSELDRLVALRVAYWKPISLAILEYGKVISVDDTYVHFEFIGYHHRYVQSKVRQDQLEMWHSVKAPNLNAVFWETVYQSWLEFEDEAKAGAYCGYCDELRGKRALLRMKGGQILAQFNDLSSHLAYGWHRFSRNDFNVDRDS